ncbi:hypothetical protein TNCV_3222402 [Trichonephila clavipes]|nr:hypothetical protein TNCV_3222402 [Trichonephila clavipes]
MSDEKKVVVEAVLKKLREENLDKFKSAFTTFVNKVDELASDAKADSESQEVSNMGTNHEENRDFDLDSEVDEENPVSDMKAWENTAWKFPCVSDMHSSREANQSSSSNSDNDVEMDITSVEQMWQKINDLKNFKRQQKDEKNVQQYCGHPYINESNPVWELAPAHIFECPLIAALPELGIILSSTNFYVDNIEQIARTVIWAHGTV